MNREAVNPYYELTRTVKIPFKSEVSTFKTGFLFSPEEYLIPGKITGLDINELFLKLLYHLGNRGSIQEVRNDQITLESLFVLVECIHPNRRWMLIPERKMNTYASCFETLWVLSGSGRIGLLKR